jgi:hypothetical protein
MARDQGRSGVVNRFRRLTCALGLVCALWLVADGGIAGAAARATVNPVFRPILAQLKGLEVTVLLPTFIPHQHEKGLHLYAEVDDKGRYSYFVDLGYAPNCGGATVCRFGSVTGGAEVDTPTIFDYPRGRHVHLRNGALALFFPYTCGASCGDSVLVFQVDGIVYTVSIKAGSLQDVLAMANSVAPAITP